MKSEMVDTPTEEKRDAKFTPGPLTASGNGVHKGVRCVAITFDPENGRRDTDVAQANAKLFAAAPDLYKASLLALTELRAMRDEHQEWWDFNVTPELCTAWDKLRAALALVDGPQNQEKK